MRRFLLLVLALLTGSEASSVEGCRQGWVEFICKYPKPDENYAVIYVKRADREARIPTRRNVWEAKGRVSVYHDTVRKNLRVHVKGLEDSGEYKYKHCHIFQSSQNVSKGAETSINCERRDDDDDGDGGVFFCKENKSTCEVISSSPNIVLTPTDRGLAVSIRDVSSHDAGVYWCGVTSDDGHRAGLRRIQLEVKDASTTVIPSIATSAATSTVSLTQSPSAAADSDDGSWLIVVIIIAVICVLLLLILVFVWKRFKQIKKTRNAEVQNKKLDALYEEIQERPQQPGSGTALKSIYVTADFPTNPSAHAQISSGQSVSGAVQEDGRHPARSAVNQPSRPPDDPFYLTLNLPQPL